MSDSNSNSNHANSELPSNTAKSAEVAETLQSRNQPTNSKTNDVVPFILQSPRPNPKLILQNMEDVLNSVEEKHRQKHREKMDQRKLSRKLEMTRATGSSATQPENGSYGLETLELDKTKKYQEKYDKWPLQENSAHDNEMNNLNLTRTDNQSPTKCKKILQYFSYSEKKETLKKSGKTTITSNAFEVMMNARNRSLGTNSPGKDASSSNSPTEADDVTDKKMKRKLMLQEWAERKGGAKRKLQEERRAIFLEKHLENRAKRFKDLLLPPTVRIPEEDDMDDESITEPEGESGSSTSSTASNRKKSISEPEDAEVELIMENECASDSSKSSSPSTSKSSQICNSSRQRFVKTVESPDWETEDTELSTFISKLLSPTKKRDSLLGYFPKKELPKDLNTKAVVDNKCKSVEQLPIPIPVKLTCRSTSSLLTLTPSETVISTPNSELTPSGRPRRSCVGKFRYDSDYEIDSTNTPKRKYKRNANFHDNIENEIETITLDDSFTDLTPTQVSQKLAPLFMRSIQKVILDPKILKARQEFLQSGVPDEMRQKCNKQQQQYDKYELQLFPKISHIQQYDAEEVEPLRSDIEFYWTQPPKKKRFTLNEQLTRRKLHLGSLTNCTKKDLENALNMNMKKNVLSSKYMNLAQLAFKRLIIKKWKLHFDRFPIYRCYNQMREQYRYFRALDSSPNPDHPQSSALRRKLIRTINIFIDIDTDSEADESQQLVTNGSVLFTEKYCPLFFKQFVMNLQPVTQLRDFLLNWFNISNLYVPPNGDASDSSDFITDSSSNDSPTGNMVVLLGPTSSGKTNAVLALANTLNFNVIEINAGMPRNGKKLLQGIQEATQSHQLHKRSNDTYIHHIFPQESEFESEITKSARKSLILIEDADILFDQIDAGFVDAIYTLAATSKRPVILVASDPHCPHLQRLIAKNVIRFSVPNPLPVSSFLSTLAVIENCPIHIDDLISLHLYNRKDLRKTIHQMQFFIQSGGDRMRLEIQRSKPKSFLDILSKNCIKYFATPLDELPRKETLLHDLTEEEWKIFTRSGCRNIRYKPYYHRGLFDFYICDQNVTHRVPFPVDFQLLAVNIEKLLRESKTMLVSGAKFNKFTKLKPRSTAKVTSNYSAFTDGQPFDILTQFYENISVASQFETYSIGQSGRKSDDGNSDDKLNPNLTAEIAHDLVERAIKVNLMPDNFPYKLYEFKPKEKTVLDHLNTTGLHSRSSRFLDYEPALRNICRSESLRYDEQQPSSRFYHHLRSISMDSVDFASKPFDKLCTIFTPDYNRFD